MKEHACVRKLCNSTKNCKQIAKRWVQKLDLKNSTVNSQY